MSVIFTKSATTYTIRSPLFPYRVEFLSNTIKEFTEGGTVITEELAEDVEVIVLRFESLSTTERDNLKAFFATTLENGSLTFTFTGPDAVEHTARWMDETFDFQMDSEGLWSGDITLRYE